MSILIITALGLANAVSAQVVRPTPAPTPAREAVDQGIFRAARALESSPRWTMAVPFAASCAASLALDAQAVF